MPEIQLPLVLSLVQICCHRKTVRLHMVERLIDAVFPFVPGDICNHKCKLISVLRSFHLHFLHIIPVLQRFLFLFYRSKIILHKLSAKLFISDQYTADCSQHSQTDKTDSPFHAFFRLYPHDDQRKYNADRKVCIQEIPHAIFYGRFKLHSIRKQTRTREHHHKCHNTSTFLLHFTQRIQEVPSLMQIAAHNCKHTDNPKCHHRIVKPRHRPARKRSRFHYIERCRRVACRPAIAKDCHDEQIRKYNSK